MRFVPVLYNDGCRAWSSFERQFMLDALSDKFEIALKKLSGRGKISETNVREAMEQVRTALLEADVHFEVVEQFCRTIVDKAIGTDVLDSLKPAQQMIKIVYDELVELMGETEDPTPQASGPIMFVEPGPTVIMMCGLQGSGKTTTCAKLATYLVARHKQVMLAAADLQRPAAITQLEVLARQAQEVSEAKGGRPVHFYAEPKRVAEYGKAVGAAVKVCRNAVKAARDTGCDVLILDTAGRLHINDDLMNELRQVNASVNPHQIYLVIDAMTGQDAVNSARAFNEQLELDGVVLTKFDSDTRGGAALSVKQVTSKPIKFIGVGEQLNALEEFHAQRMAGRILGMGDMVSLVEKAQEQVSAEEALALQEKMAKGKMTMDDFLNQLRTMRKMGSVQSLLGMLPGIGKQMKDIDLDDKEIDRTEAIIQSMTANERCDVDLLNNSRRRRVAKGSGTEQKDVSQLVKGFEMARQMTKQMSGMNLSGRMKAMAGLGQMDLAALGSRGGNAPKLANAPKNDKGRSRIKIRKRKSR